MGTDTAENELRAELSVTITHMVLLTLRSSVCEQKNSQELLRNVLGLGDASREIQSLFCTFSTMVTVSYVLDYTAS